MLSPHVKEQAMCVFTVNTIKSVMHR